MAGQLGAAAGPGVVLLLSCVIFGNGLNVEILSGRNDQLFKNNLIRQKREWVVPPVSVWEERDNSNRNPIARIYSDRVEKGLKITYIISGPGVTEPPYHLFVINGKTGELNITGIVDREKTPFFKLKGLAMSQDGTQVENALDLRVNVLDVNDNSPVFSQEVFVGSVEEMCELGTLVMKISATDADEPNNLNSKIAYRIVSQGPSQANSVFQIDRSTGEVRTSTLQLDREMWSSYTLVVEAKDRDGGLGGMAHQTTLQITVLDVNDNIPVLEKTMYEGSVTENTANVEILRLKVFDRDEEFSDNWLANYTIVSGNEGGYFHIERDSHTNEGILTVVKEINYEELQTLDLKIVVSNQAAYHKSIISQGYQAKPIPIKIKVENVMEGPIFKPSTLVIKATETMKVNQIIGSFQAFDEDTQKIAQRVRYAKGHDAGNWFIIDSRTAEIKLIKVPDYESPFVVNGTYTATIVAITEDFPAKTVTGTINIQVEDFNDHCPTLVTRETTVCTDAKYINITAEDRDAHPNGGPFTFSIIDEPERMSDRWIIGQQDGFRAHIVPQDVKPGIYEVPLLVKDNQGLSCPEPQILTMHICDCVAGAGCRETRVGSSVMLGPAAIALIILALLLLLLVPLLLLACRFGSGAAAGFAAIPDNSEEMLRNWNNEGAAPEDKAFLPLITPPALDTSGSNMVGGAGVKGAGSTVSNVGGGVSSSVNKEHYSNVQMVDGRWQEQTTLLSQAGHGGMHFAGGLGMAGGRGMAGGGGMAGGTMTSIGRRAMTLEKGGAINEEFLRSYFCEKADAFADEDEAHLAKDCLLVYSQEEEKESPHGSIGCCSFIEGDFDDHFLDDLGDKFKTLADICTGKRVGMEVGHHSSAVLTDAGPSPAMNESDAQYLHQHDTINSELTYTSGPSYQLPEPVKSVGSETLTKVSVRSVPDPVVSSSNVVVTETTYGARPPTLILDPQFKENVVVTERVLAPASSLQDMLERPAGVFPDLSDSKYVVVRERERVLVPNSELKASLSIPNLSEGQNVVVSERVVTPTAGMWSTAEPPTFSDIDRQEKIFISDPFFNQAGPQEALPSGSAISKSSTVKKYSSVQYTRS
ncbi:desmoglein-2 [Elgaria multicarinata webbii]|uniref:desmoglein-2 n=1 Tax=Elgaria multicarinata webbii TaxID=159646 RepID=UPI002FCCC514